MGDNHQPAKLPPFDMADAACGQLFNAVSAVLRRGDCRLYFSGRLKIAEACYGVIMQAGAAAKAEGRVRYDPHQPQA